MLVARLEENMNLSAKKQRLKEIIAEKSLKTGNFKLASGASSTYLFDLKPTILDPEGANLTADLILDMLPDDITAIGGLELGACPIVSAICVRSYQLGRELKTFYVRKEKKDRGSNKLIEGPEITSQDKVLMVEDVTTKGGSVLTAINTVKQQGCVVNQVISVVNRLEGAKENLATENISLKSIFTRHDFNIPS